MIDEINGLLGSKIVRAVITDNPTKEEKRLATARAIPSWPDLQWMRGPREPIHEGLVQARLF
jgi:hypothetical protein